MGYRAALLALVGLAACSGSQQESRLVRPAGPMNVDEARVYALGLVNHDRAGQGLTPVELDETATRAAQRHVEDMVRHGFTAHWGTDGSVPEQRYTEAGGSDFNMENAACFFDGASRDCGMGHIAGKCPLFSRDRQSHVGPFSRPRFRRSSR